VNTRVLKIFIFAVLMCVLVAGCSSGPELLQVTGAVTDGGGYTEKALKGLGAIDVDYTNKDGETTTFNGVPIIDVLEDAGVEPTASAVVFVGSDGYEAEVTMREIQMCGSCIVAFDDDGTLRMVLPDFSSSVQVKEVVELRVR
jgi:hypothetical protein